MRCEGRASLIAPAVPLASGPRLCRVDLFILGLLQATNVPACVSVLPSHPLLLNPLSKNCKQTREESVLKARFMCRCVSDDFYVLVQLPASSSVAHRRGVPLTFPTSCYQLAPSNGGCWLLHSPSDFFPGILFLFFLLCCFSFLLSNFTFFPVHGLSQAD